MNTDASEIALGVVLYQLKEEGGQKVIAFGSRSLYAFETRDTITEKELMSVIFGCRKFRNFILGMKLL